MKSTIVTNYKPNFEGRIHGLSG